MIENLLKYCLVNFQTRGSSRLLSAFIYQVLRELDIDAPAVEGVVYVEIMGHARPFAHCFNAHGCDIIDGSIYSLALINKAVGRQFPLYVAGDPPDHMEYCITGELKSGSQPQFGSEFIQAVISALASYSDVEVDRFDELADSAKKDLFYLL